MLKYFKLFALPLCFFALIIDPVGSEVDPNVAYCFQFTWMGPLYDNSTTNNSTCSDLTFEACKKPLVVTNDQTPPNTTTLWENYNSHVACKMAKGHVCAKWIYSFSGAVEYITYLCTKITIDSQSAMTSGCLEQTEGSYVKKVCACRSYAGQTPCNSASHPIANIIILLVTAITILHA